MYDIYSYIIGLIGYSTIILTLGSSFVCTLILIKVRKSQKKYSIPDHIADEILLQSYPKLWSFVKSLAYSEEPLRIKNIQQAIVSFFLIVFIVPLFFFIIIGTLVLFEDLIFGILLSFVNVCFVYFYRKSNKFVQNIDAQLSKIRLVDPFADFHENQKLADSTSEES
jgi:hypothetical protein